MATNLRTGHNITAVLSSGNFLSDHLIYIELKLSWFEIPFRSPYSEKQNDIFIEMELWWNVH